MESRTKWHTDSFWFWKELPGLHCMPGTTEGEKTLPAMTAASPTLLESAKPVPSLVLAVCGKIILLLSGETKGCTIPPPPSLSSAPKVLLFDMSLAEGTAPRPPLLGIVMPELSGTLVDGWLDGTPLPMPLTSPVSTRAGEDLLPGKLAISSSFAELDTLTGDEIAVPAFSRTPRTEVELGRIVGAGDADKLWAETFKGIGVAWLPVGVDEAEEPITLFLAGGVLGPISELLSCEAVSSDCSWMEVLCWRGDVTVAWKSGAFISNEVK